MYIYISLFPSSLRSLSNALSLPFFCNSVSLFVPFSYSFLPLSFVFRFVPVLLLPASASTPHAADSAPFPATVAMLSGRTAGRPWRECCRWRS